MLFALGVGSAVSWQMAVVTVICDDFPKLKRFHVIVVSCVLCFFLGLIYVTPGGQFMLTLVDNFSGNFVIYVLATLEVIALAWIYGLRSVVRDIRFMLGMEVGIYWKFCWSIFVPIFLSVVLIYSLVTMETLEYNGATFPTSALVSGWLLAAACLCLVPGFAMWEIHKAPGTTFLQVEINTKA